MGDDGGCHEGGKSGGALRVAVLGQMREEGTIEAVGRWSYPRWRSALQRHQNRGCGAKATVAPFAAVLDDDVVDAEGSG